ncbi:MAG: DNA-binding protein WhiA [Eubacterium sp.]|nr:DNA-binding protein WhiA [Eubacterium sp.]
MSFATEVKNELARSEAEKKCCQLAEIAGFLRVAGSLRLAGAGKFKIAVSTEIPAVARHYKRLIKEYFKVDTRLEIGEGFGFSKTRSYMLTIGPEERSEQILRETGILLVREGNNFISDGIYDELVRTKCCRKSYLKGVFLAAGSVNNPDKTYHLEFVCNSERLALDLKKLINGFVDMTAKTMERRGKYIVYIKNLSNIRDMLAIMGAHSHVLSFDNTVIKKQMRNQTVRITNCDNANMDRALDAAQRQLAAIRAIEAAGLFDKLPPRLRGTARLRLENPDASLTQLGELCAPPLKKAGINSRIQKILSFAEEHGCI